MRLDESRREEQAENSEGENKLEGMKTRGRSLEVTGLGIIASLIVAFWSLVNDGTIRLSEYLIFVSFLLISAGGIVWRLLKLAPDGRTVREVRLKPGCYRVSYRRRNSLDR